MPRQQTRPDRAASSSSCSLCCFGFSMNVASDKRSPGNSYSGREKSVRRRLSFHGFRIKKSSSKTVPVDSTTTDPKTTNRNSEIQATTSSDQTLTAAAVATAETPPPQEETVLIVNRKHSGQLGLARKDTYQKRPEEDKPKLRRRISDASFPTRNAHKQPPANPAHPYDIDNQGALEEKLGPLIGMSIIVVTLFIMLLWGRLCAIVCTCAWCYFIPRRLRAPAAVNKLSDGVIRKNSDPNSNTMDPDLSSEEYKKKVVLKGFLERNHRSKLGAGAVQ